MTNDKKLNPHVNHRKRLYELAEKNGLENLTDIQCLELLLTYIIPRKDTNELAHLLLDEFGSMAAVLDAPISALQKIDGVGKRTAQMLSFMPKFFYLYRTTKYSEKQKFETRSQIYEFVEDFLQYSNYEEFFLIGLNANNCLIKAKKIAQGVANSVEVDPAKVLDFLNTFKPVNLIIAHSHAENPAYPSNSDFVATNMIKSLAMITKAKVIDHIIVGKDGVYSFHDHGKL